MVSRDPSHFEGPFRQKASVNGLVDFKELYQKGMSRKKFGVAPRRDVFSRSSPQSIEKDIKVNSPKQMVWSLFAHDVQNIQIDHRLVVM